MKNTCLTNWSKIALCSAGCALSPLVASAAITVDGTLDAGYGAALSVQTVQTGFGDANPNNGSELDAAYGKIDSGRLHVMLTGNIEANFNKLEIFIDSKAGGQNIFISAGNDGAAAMNGLKFDAGFTADYHLIIRRGNGNTFDVDFANLGAATASSYGNVFGGAEAGSGTTGTGVNANTIGVAYDNSNVAGVSGGTGAANQAAASAVTTGLELSIDLADLGYIGGDILVMAGQNNSGHNYWANQFLGGLTAPQGNLGGDGSGNFNGSGAIDLTAGYAGGDQFFTVVPEPSSLALAGLGIAAILMFRRKK